MRPKCRHCDKRAANSFGTLCVVHMAQVINRQYQLRKQAAKKFIIRIKKEEE